MMSVERAKVELCGTLNQLGPNKQSLNEAGRREVLYHGQMREVPGQWNHFASLSLVRISQSIQILRLFVTRVAMHFNGWLELKLSALLNELERQLQGIFRRCVVVAQLHVDVRCARLFILDQQPAKLAGVS